MLLRNDLLHYMHPAPRTVRILWIAPEQSHAYVFDVSARSAEVELVPMAVLLADIKSGRAHRLRSDPYLVVLGRAPLPPKHLQLRARAWDIIQSLTAQEPDIYDARRRGQLIAQHTRLHGVSHPTIYRYLRRYWQRGQTPNALLPDYCNSGGRGKMRAASEGVKRGRPRKSGTDQGLNADDEIRRVFRVATAHYAATHDKFSRRAAYLMMIRDFFNGRHVDLQAGRVWLGAADAAEAAVPSFGQFNYWLDQDDDRPPSVARRRGVGLGPAASEAWVFEDAALPGLSQPLAEAQPEPRRMQLVPVLIPPPGRPGAGFHLDAVQAGIQLVSSADRGQLVGHPVLYMVVDHFSRMITGLHVALHGVAWEHALVALANCGMNKQSHCRQWGRVIGAAEWPCQHFPEILYARPALMAGGGDALLNNFNLRCLPSDDAPEDWHAVLAKRVLLSSIMAAAPQGSRLDGALDLDQFTRVVIEAVIYYNNRHPLPQAGGATPCQLWEWGVQHRGGALRTYDEPLLRFALLAS